jgi:xylan 1,4-beta-xylosidase
VTSSRMYPLFSIRDSGVRKEITDVGAIAAKDKRNATVMIWNYHDDDSAAGEPVRVAVFVDGLPRKQQVTVNEYRIDFKHSNS